MLEPSSILLLLGGITLLAGIASRTGISYPVVLVLGGLGLAFVPGATPPPLDPHVVLYVFLPPLVYSAAFLSSPQELRANASPILFLAVGLVLVTVAAVALVGHLVAGLSWPVAFVLGAVLGPTDPVAATAVVRRLGAPTRITTILEGEALVNDGIGLTAYAVAVTAVTAGFSLWGAVAQFTVAVVAGVAIGLVTAFLMFAARSRVDEVRVEFAISLLTPFLAYLAADAIGASGVLSAVAAGLYAGSRESRASGASTRLRVHDFWELAGFLLNAILFLLVGLELRRVLAAIGGVSPALLLHAAGIATSVVAVRLAWVFLGPLTRESLAGSDVTTSLREMGGTQVVLGWSAMRGAVSLAMALATPAFPERPAVIFLTYASVLLTLVAPGLTLGRLLRRVGLEQGPTRRREAAEARAELVHVALARLEAMASDGLSDDAERRLRGIYELQLEPLERELDRDGRAADGDETTAAVHRALIRAQQQHLGELRRRMAYPPQVLRAVQHELDLEESRLG